MQKKMSLQQLAVTWLIIATLCCLAAHSVGGQKEAFLFEVPQIERTVLVDQDNIVVTAEEIVPIRTGAWALSITIENHSDVCVGVQCGWLSVNHLQDNQFTDHFICSVEAGQSVSGHIHFDKYFERLKMRTITDMQFVFIAREEYVDPATHFVTSYDLFTTDIIELRTINAKDGLITPEFDGGYEVYNQDGIRVVFRDTKKWGIHPSLHSEVFIENHSYRNLAIIRDPLFVDGIQQDDGVQFKLRAGNYNYVNMGKFRQSKLPKENDWENHITSYFSLIDLDTREILTEEYIPFQLEK